MHLSIISIRLQRSSAARFEHIGRLLLFKCHCLLGTGDTYCRHYHMSLVYDATEVVIRAFMVLYCL